MSVRSVCPSIELLDDEMLAVRRFPDVVDRDDIGVIQRGGGAGLAQKARERRRLAPRMRVHHLDGDRAVQPRVERAEHFSHAAAADARIDAVVPERGRYHHLDGGLQRPRALYI